MLKKLQRKFIVIAMFALASVIMVQSFAVNAVHIYQRDSDVRQTLRVIAENGGVLPNNYMGYDDMLSFWRPFVDNPSGLESVYTTRYFSVELFGNVVTGLSTEHIAAVDDNEALEYAATVCAGEPGYGFVGVYRYYYLRQPSGKAIIVFVDFQKEIAQSAALATASIIVSVVTMVILLICVYWLSKKAMQPVADSIEKQKQFITDASHELKTPLAIISADAEVMEICEGENEWLTSIKNQTVRMNHLVKNLVELSKLNEMHDEASVRFFNISKALIETAESFEGVAQIADKSYVYSAVPDVVYKGSEEEIRQLITILCDNAIKYTNEGGSIKLTLYRAGKNIIIEITNTCEYIDPATVSRMFDRFYRADSSRARNEQTGGYGIGLSIAKAIVDRHKGRIRVFTAGTTSVTFKVTL